MKNFATDKTAHILQISLAPKYISIEHYHLYTGRIQQHVYILCVPLSLIEVVYAKTEYMYIYICMYIYI